MTSARSSNRGASAATPDDGEQDDEPVVMPSVHTKEEGEATYDARMKMDVGVCVRERVVWT